MRPLCRGNEPWILSPCTPPSESTLSGALSLRGRKVPGFGLQSLLFLLRCARRLRGASGGKASNPATSGNSRFWKLNAGGRCGGTSRLSHKTPIVNPSALWKDQLVVGRKQGFVQTAPTFWPCAEMPESRGCKQKKSRVNYAARGRLCS